MAIRKPLYRGDDGTPTEMSLSDELPVGYLPTLTDLAVPANTVLTLASPGEVIQFDGSVWRNTPLSMGNPGTGGVQTFFSASPAISATGAENALPVNTLTRVPVLTGELTVSSTVGVGASLPLAAWLHDTPIGLTTIPTGLWTATLFCGVDSVAEDRLTLVYRRMFEVIPEAMTLTTTGTGISRTVTAASGTPFVTGDANTDRMAASFLQTPKGLYPITGYTSPTVVTIAVPAGYGNESAVAWKKWRGLFISTGTGATVTALSPTYMPFSWDSMQPAFTVAATSHLGAMDYAHALAGGPTTMTIVYDGDPDVTRNSRISSPMPAGGSGELTALTTTQMASLTTATADAMTTAQLEGLASMVVKGLTTAQLASLTTTQLSALAGSDLLTPTLAVAFNEAKVSVAAHATACDIWSAAGNIIELTGAATTFTNFPAAPQAGARRTLICKAAHLFVNSDPVAVTGNANYTAAINDVVEIVALTTTTFLVSVQSTVAGWAMVTANVLTYSGMSKSVDPVDPAYDLYTHTTVGTASITFNNAVNIGCLIVASGGGGGGAGGGVGGGGGGAGGFYYNSTLAVTAQSYTLTLGDKGLGVANPGGNGARGTNGGDASCIGQDASGPPVMKGGGAGAGYLGASLIGGSGGAGAYGQISGAAGTSGQGNAGGTATGSYAGAGGGGSGGGGVADTDSATGGAGGPGTSCSISGVATPYGCGGGGGGNVAGGSGGSGSSGSGGSGYADGNNGDPNRGNGGGGAAPSGPNKKGGDGGLGIIILRVKRAP